MFLDDLLETGIVQLGVLCQVMHIGNNVAEVCFEQGEVLLKAIIRIVRLVDLFLLLNDLFNLAFARLYPADYLRTLDLLECEDLIKLGLEQVDKLPLLFLVPLFPFTILSVLEW